MNTQMLPPALCLMGPTASGKTDVSIFLAENLPCEIISVDSAQIYRGMDIGTAKPEPCLRRKFPHHLIDIRDAGAVYSVAEFYEDAKRLMQDITRRGRVPLLSGGTFLYFRALEQGLDPLPPADEQVRADIAQQACQEGWGAMHHLLEKIDPESAQRIDCNDAQRIQRALEVFAVTGKPMTHFFSDNQNKGLPYRFIKFALLPGNRAWLYRRIDQRFDEMIRQGLIEEVRALFYVDGVYISGHASRIVGYRQLLQYLHGQMGREEAIEKAKTASRRYAKRQLTWLRREENMMRFAAESPAINMDILKFIHKKLAV